MPLALEAAALVVAAVVLARLAALVRLPPILGMIAGGVLLGALELPFGPGPVGIADVSGPIRFAILAVILLRAGLGLSLADVRRSGGLALRLGLLPVLGDTALVTAAGVVLLDLPLATAVVLGFVVAAISPAIVIPGLLALIGRRKGQPLLTALLVGAPLDNLVAVTGLGIALEIALAGGDGWVAVALALPYKIGLGITAGVVVGLLVATAAAHVAALHNGRVAAALAWALAGAMVAAGLSFGFSFVLAIVAFGMTLRTRAPALARETSEPLAGVWKVAQYVLFALIGFAIDLDPLLGIGFALVAVVVVGQLGRAGGVAAATVGSRPHGRAWLVCVLAYVPKATIQAAFAALPLDRGLPSGDLILAAGVLAVAVTAPIGVLTLNRGVDAVLGRDG